MQQSPLIPSAGDCDLQIINMEANQLPAAQGRHGDTVDGREDVEMGAIIAFDWV